MKISLQNVFLFFAFLFLDLVAFAQPGTGNVPGDLEDEDAPTAPINSRLIWLAIVGIVFAYFMIKNSRSIKAYK